MALELYAQAFAKLKNQTITQYLGKGHFGEAYLTSENTVLKITKDHCETLAALMMIGHKHNHVVTIFEVQKLPGELFIIEQEYLNHNSDADALYWQLTNIADSSGAEISDLIQQDLLEFEGFIDDELFNIIPQFRSAMDHLNTIGINGNALDFGSDNFTIVNGHITVFDNRFDTLTKSAALEKIKTNYPEIYTKPNNQEYVA